MTLAKRAYRWHVIHTASDDVFRINIVRDMENLLTHFITTITSKEGYSSLFKAGVFLVGTAMIALSQIGTFLYDKDLSAHKAAFAIEASTGKHWQALASQSVKCKTAPHSNQS